MYRYEITLKFPEGTLIRTLSSPYTIEQIYKWLKTTIFIRDANIHIREI